MGGETPGLSEEGTKGFIGHTQDGRVIAKVDAVNQYGVAAPKAGETSHQEVRDLVKRAFGHEPVPKGHVLTEGEAQMMEDLKIHEQGEHNN